MEVVAAEVVVGDCHMGAAPHELLRGVVPAPDRRQAIVLPAEERQLDRRPADLVEVRQLDRRPADLAGAHPQDQLPVDRERAVGARTLVARVRRSDSAPAAVLDVLALGPDAPARATDVRDWAVTDRIWVVEI